MCSAMSKCSDYKLYDYLTKIIDIFFANGYPEKSYSK